MTFVLLGRDGEELGRVRKRKAAAQEAYYVASDTDQSHVLTVTDSKLGSLKIGVGICYENYHIQLPCHFQAQGVDLVLQPHSANIMGLNGAPLAKLYATTLGVPVVMVNKYNPEENFPGNSAIAYFDEEGQFDIKGPFKEDNQTDNSSAHEGKPPVEEPSGEQKVSFTATFPLKKSTSRPINCDPNVIGTEPQLWPEALIPFSDYPAWESSQHLETFAVLQEKIDQIIMVSHELKKLQSLVGTDPQSWPAISRSLHVLLLKTIPLLKPEEALPYASLLKNLPPLEAKDALREDITDEHLNDLKDLLLILPELEKLESLLGTTIGIKNFFEGVEDEGGKFYNGTYLKGRIEWAEKMAKPPSDSQTTPSKDKETESKTENKDDKTDNETNEDKTEDDD